MIIFHLQEVNELDPPPALEDPNPLEPLDDDPNPPPPPPEAPWSEEESEVVHLNEESFKPFLKKRKHVLVMFYAPWYVCKISLSLLSLERYIRNYNF